MTHDSVRYLKTDQKGKSVEITQANIPLLCLPEAARTIKYLHNETEVYSSFWLLFTQ